MTSRLVLLRHGESVWNKQNRFTGWTDVDLSAAGVDEARAAGRLLKAEGYVFDAAYTSVLKRAIKTLWLALEELDQMWIPVTNAWQLNERHYGSLQGLNKTEMAAEYGDKQVLVWRRSYDTPPPPLAASDPRSPSADPRYAQLSAAEQPLTECLKDTVARVVPYWHKVIVPELRAGRRLVIVAHGNSIRALRKYLEDISDAEIVDMNIPTATPLIYEFDTMLRPVKHYYLGDAARIAAAQAAVANQGKANT